MAITLAGLRQLSVREHPVSYDERDTMLYALSLGMGEDAADPAAECFISELQGLRALPTQATVLARTPLLKDCGLDFSRLLHGEQRLVLHRPVPPQGRLLLDAHVSSVVDMGANKGARVCAQTVGRIAGQTQPLFTAQSILFARGDGGIGSVGDSLTPLRAVPERAADQTVVLNTRADQAYLYRLNGDRNPIHIDHAVARRAGLERPLLHGLCTFGMCARALLAPLGHGAERIACLEARFVAPIYPGEALTVDSWQVPGGLAFRARVAQRDVVCISHGHCGLRDDSS